MKTMDEISSAMGFFLVFASFWLLVFVFWRLYRVASLRQDLFAMRDDLFDYAASGFIGFDNEAYLKMREEINSLIRFAHKLTTGRAIMGTLLSLSSNVKKDGDSPSEGAIASLPEGEAKEYMNRILMRVRIRIALYIVSGFPFFILWCIFIISARALYRAANEWADRKLNELAQYSLIEIQAREARASFSLT